MAAASGTKEDAETISIDYEIGSSFARTVAVAGRGQDVFVAITSTVSFQVRNPGTSIVTAKRPM